MIVKQRGYNLVEIAIVLTVALMMASWMMTNYYQWEKQNRQQETERAINSIKDAIVTYASEHTAAANVIVNGDSTSGHLWRLSADRPYLPCPDVTGDGLEDRQPLVTVAVLTIRAGASDLEAGGNCYKSKGWVPWKTLNVPPADPWGNLYTYRVGSHFSNAAIGFDQETRNDQASYTRPLLTVEYQQTLTVAGAVAGTVTLVGVERAPIAVSAVVLASSAPLEAVNVSLTVTNQSPPPSPPLGFFTSEDAPSVICSSAPCPYGTGVSIIAGELVTGNVTVTRRSGGYRVGADVYATYVSGNIINGPPVVILSHGQNGYGAMAANLGSDSVKKCRAVPADRNDELQNALTKNGISHVDLDCPARLKAGYVQNGFVLRPRVDSSSAPAVEGFDDILGWMSTEELISALQERGALPAGLLPPVGLEGY